MVLLLEGDNEFFIFLHILCWRLSLAVGGLGCLLNLSLHLRLGVLLQLRWLVQLNLLSLHLALNW